MGGSASDSREEAKPHLEKLDAQGIAEAPFQLGVLDIRHQNYPGALWRMRRSLRLNPGHEPTQQQIAALEKLLDPDDRSALQPGKPENLGLLVGSHVGALGPASFSMSVCIVTFNSAETIIPCAESVLKDLAEDGELILVDNASQDGTPEVLEKIRQSDPRVQVVLNPENVGYAKAMNQALLMSKGGHLLLLNPDTKIYRGGLEDLSSRLSEGVSAVGPLTNYVTGQQQVLFHLPDNVRPPLDEVPAVIGTARKGETLKTKLLMGFCVISTRSLLDIHGLLDEGMELGADDLEFSWRLRALGFDLMVAASTFVAHSGARSFASLDSTERHQRVR